MKKINHRSSIYKFIRIYDESGLKLAVAEELVARGVIAKVFFFFFFLFSASARPREPKLIIIFA